MMVDAEALCRSRLFQDLTEADRTWIASEADEVVMQTDEVVMQEGDPCGNFFVVLDGSLQVSKLGRGGQPMTLATLTVGDFVGEMSMLTGKEHTATVKAVGEARLLRFNPKVFSQTISRFAPVSALLAQALAERVQANEAHMRQREKMAALGSLAAGLAHNLNNPAAAGVSASSQLRDTLEEWKLHAVQLSGVGLPSHTLAYLAEFQAELMEQAANAPRLDPIRQSDLEDELATWLDANGLVDGWEVASTFVTAGLNAAQLSICRDRVPAAAFPYVMQWLEDVLAVDALVRTVEHSTNRIAALVNAVKDYAFMDQAPVQEIDIHDGIEKTLVILGHKIGGGLHIVRDFAPDLPRVMAYGSELNQVWTSLIDNAIDAVNEEGIIRLRTWAIDDDHIGVEIGDSGAGIPTDIQQHIFEPFFTTKANGGGTGLGLDIAYRIIGEHHGTMTVVSQPGDTRFFVHLPIQAVRD